LSYKWWDSNPTLRNPKHCYAVGWVHQPTNLKSTLQNAIFFVVFCDDRLQSNMANYKRIFLDGYSYFITVVTYERRPILIDNIDFLRESFRQTKKYYHFYINEIIIMPDHFHMIITPSNATDYPKIIKSIKYGFTKLYQCDAGISQSLSRKKDGMQPV
jgi:REP element-mobilizing transposase RayT